MFTIEVEKSRVLKYGNESSLRDVDLGSDLHGKKSSCLDEHASGRARLSCSSSDDCDLECGDLWFRGV